MRMPSVRFRRAAPIRASMLATVLALAALLALGGCDGLPDSGRVGEVVVDGTLEVDAPLGAVRVRRSAVPGQTSPLLTDADVGVELLAESGDAVEARYPYRLAAFDSGRYVPLDTAARVQPLRRYRLVVRPPGADAPTTSTTLTPTAFDVLDVSDDTLRYDPTPGAPLFGVRITRPTYPGRNAIFVFTTETLLAAPTVADATPFFRAALDNDNDGEVDDPEDFDLADLRRGSSPLLNEANYTRNPDGTLTIELPWISVVFYGPSRISASSVDDNLNDFLRSVVVQQGGGTSAPGEILNVLDRVENGTGVFGSYSRVSTTVVVTR